MKNYPNFFIVGAAKSGTTSLFHYLKQHPEIFLPNTKENFFFAELRKNTFTGVGNFYGDNIVEKWDDYLKLFRGIKSEIAIGEACVGYLYFYEKTIKNMKKYLSYFPKIIILLRNPVERAFSNYSHHVRDGIENLSFEKVINRQIIEQRADQNYWWGFDYIKVGLYYSQVKAYVSTFGKENVRIYLHEDLNEAPTQVLKDIFKFLKVDESFNPDTKTKYNISGIPKSKKLQDFLLGHDSSFKKLVRPIAFKLIGKEKTEKIVNSFWNKNLKRLNIDPEIKCKLSELYREDILKLQNLINRDLSSWLT